MVVGLRNGFASGSQMFVDYVAYVCNECIKQAKAILGIASPSKEFAKIGAFTMEGMQVGLEKTGEGAIDTVSDIVDSIIEEAENGNGIQTNLGIMTDGLDNVTNKMERIAQIFSDIADTIAQMGGLEVPTIASGKVIPYKTQLADTSTTSVGATSMNGLEDALYSAFTRAMGNTENQQPIEVRLVVDGRTLADIVTKQQRAQQRAWGV